MDEITENYNLENLEQLRAVADHLRLRIIDQLSQRAMTVTQLAELLGEAPSRLHYHVRELEKVGLLKLVETREKGGILEKYYRSVAKNINVPGTLFRDAPPDEVISTLNEVIQPLLQGFIDTAQQMLRTQAWDNPDQMLVLSPEHYWMTKDEFVEVNKQIVDLLKPYKEPRGIEREHEQAIMWIGYTIPHAAEQIEEAPASTPQKAPASPTSPRPVKAPASPIAPRPVKAPKRELTIVAGAVHYGRKNLEKVLAEGQTMDMYMLGACTFADDVTPDLIERAIHSFRLWGRLNASPEVREALKHKGGDIDKKNITAF